MKRVLVVLSGGGMKGFAHIGALRVLRRLDIPIVAFAGTSVGAFVAAMAAGGLTVAEIERVALGSGRRDIMDFDWWGLLSKRMKMPAFNRGRRILESVRRALPTDDFEDLVTPLFINAVDLASGCNVVFGLKGMRDVPISRTVAASCAIPGIYPPVTIRGRRFVDGSVVDNLQLRMARLLDIDFVIAVNLRSHTPVKSSFVEDMGFLDIITRGNDLTGETVTEINLAKPIDVPGILVHPDVAEHHYLEFRNVAALIAEGERATEAAFERYSRTRQDESIWSWFFPGSSRKVSNPFVIDKSRCVRCGLCVVNNMDGIFHQAGPDAPITIDRHKPSSHDLAPLKECPFGAIRLDSGMLEEMYGDEIPTHLARLANRQDEFFGEPAFVPEPHEVVFDDEPEPAAEVGSGSRRLSLLGRRSATGPVGRGTGNSRLPAVAADRGARLAASQDGSGGNGSTPDGGSDPGAQTDADGNGEDVGLPEAGHSVADSPEDDATSAGSA